MTTAKDCDRAPTRWTQIGFYATSIIFNICLIAQLLAVGVAYFNNPTWWNIRVWHTSSIVSPATQLTHQI